MIKGLYDWVYSGPDGFRAERPEVIEQACKYAGVDYIEPGTYVPLKKKDRGSARWWRKRSSGCRCSSSA